MRLLRFLGIRAPTRVPAAVLFATRYNSSPLTSNSSLVLVRAAGLCLYMGLQVRENAYRDRPYRLCPGK